MAKAFGIVSFEKNNIWVEGLQNYRPISAFSFMGRYRVVDFSLSNLSNSDIDQIQVYVKQNPRSLVEHIGTGRQYNINSKRGRLHTLFSDTTSTSDIYNNDMNAYRTNKEFIAARPEEYVVITPGYMVFTQDFERLLEQHICSEADITLLYHRVDQARSSNLSDDVLNLNRQKGVTSIERNPGNTDKRNIFMDTYVMKTELFLQLIEDSKNISSIYTLMDTVNSKLADLDVRGVQHKGYFAAITDFKSYVDAHSKLLDFEVAKTLIDDNWPIYTITRDSAPSQYFEGASAKSSLVSNGCQIEGSIEHSMIGRACQIGKNAVVKNCILLPNVVIGEGVHVENMVIDRKAVLNQKKEYIATPEKPAYIKRGDHL